MDLHMPVMDGTEAVETLRGLEAEGKLDLSNTKIIALSAINESEYDRVNDQKLFDYFRKSSLLSLNILNSIKTCCHQ